uniref:PiggyBac transposable element-derived protein 3 n=1 Tax=Bactrocera latifrons TaxID=174628 RepID=A0A0K8UMZ4_BACLA
MGATGNVVVRLTQTVPNFKNHIVYFDNFYTSLALLVYLRSRGIYALGTVHANRLPNCKLSKDIDVKNKERGYAEEFVGTAFGVDITSVLWKDTKYVRLVSTYAGVKPFCTSTDTCQPPKVTRFDRKEKEYVDIDCPTIVKEYNRHMGGVDLMDDLIGRYHIRLKPKKWTLRLFHHMLDIAVVNAYIIYHRIHDVDLTHRHRIKLPDFRVEIADVLSTNENWLSHIYTTS